MKIFKTISEWATKEKINFNDDMAAAWDAREPEIRDLKEQIKKMRNCTNCGKNASYVDRQNCPLRTDIFFCSNWILGKYL